MNTATATPDTAPLSANDVKMLRALPELLKVLQAAQTAGDLPPHVSEAIERVGWANDVRLINR